MTIKDILFRSLSTGAVDPYMKFFFYNLNHEISFENEKTKK